jgi:hypothetical protein
MEGEGKEKGREEKAKRDPSKTKVEKKKQTRA